MNKNENQENLGQLEEKTYQPYKIGVDCRMWRETGVGRYVRNIVRKISEYDNTNQYYLFLLEKDLGFVDLPENFIKVKADVRWHTLKEQLTLPFLFKKYDLDLLFVPHFNVPILYPGKYVAAIHDLTILKIKTGRATTLPYPLYLIKRIAFKFNVFNTLHRGKAIFTVSDFVRKDLIDTFKLKRSVQKIKIVPCAASDNFTPVPNEKAREIVGKYDIPLEEKYIFYVGNAHPHKNLESLVSAFNIMSEKHDSLNLVLGGKKEFFYSRLERETELKYPHLVSRIFFPGFIEDEDLPSLYSSASVAVIPSLYEGFGIQVLEAFACGTKVACSNTTSLPEVGGHLPFYFDPRDIANMADVISKALRAEESPNEYISRAGNFSWDEAAKKVMSELNTVLHNND